MTHHIETADSPLGDSLKVLVTLILPPLGVFLEVGLGKTFFLNVLLTLLGFIPGLVHAIWIIAKH